MSNDEVGLRMEEIVPFRGSKPASRDKPTRIVGVSPFTTSRRSLLKGAVAAGVSVGLWSIGLFSSRAYAEGYDIVDHCNGGGNKGANYDGCTACCCSTICNPECGSCCTQDGNCWHRSDGVNYSLRPDECIWTGGQNPEADGWKWKADTQNCGNCGGSTPYKRWRCHDGYTKITETQWAKTTCKKGLGCFA